MKRVMGDKARFVGRFIMRWTITLLVLGVPALGYLPPAKPQAQPPVPAVSINTGCQRIADTLAPGLTINCQ